MFFRTKKREILVKNKGYRKRCVHLFPILTNCTIFVHRTEGGGFRREEGLPSPKKETVMNAKKLLFASLITAAGAGLALVGCTGDIHYGEATVNVCQTDTVVRLVRGDESSPSCHIKLKFAYLNPYVEDDSISAAVNRTLKQMYFGNLYADLSPRKFVDTIAANLIKDYRNDVEESYLTDIRNGVSPENMPSWYNYEFEITSELEKGRDSLWNYRIATFQYTGGAHPNRWSKWVNIDAATGKPLDGKDVFAGADSAGIHRLILEKIIALSNSRLETDTITSIEGLRANGVLLDEDVYIPENFLMEDDGVEFLYNPYEIAPYSMGIFEFKIPDEDLSPYLKGKP